MADDDFRHLAATGFFFSEYAPGRRHHMHFLDIALKSHEYRPPKQRDTTVLGPPTLALLTPHIRYIRAVPALLHFCVIMRHLRRSQD